MNGASTVWCAFILQTLILFLSFIQSGHFKMILSDGSLDKIEANNQEEPRNCGRQEQYAIRELEILFFVDNQKDWCYNEYQDESKVPPDAVDVPLLIFTVEEDAL